MVCPACGVVFEGAGSFCPRCGAWVVAEAVPPQYGYGAQAAGYGVPAGSAPGYGMPPYPLWTRVQRSLHILPVLWGCLAIYRLISGLVGLVFLRGMAHGGMFGRRAFHPEMMPFFSALVPFTLVTTLAMVGLTALVAYGLLQRRPWGRTMAIVMSILSLLKFPLGTALGIYTLWVMAPAASAMEYEALADRSRPGF